MKLEYEKFLAIMENFKQTFPQKGFYGHYSSQGSSYTYNGTILMNDLDLFLLCLDTTSGSNIDNDELYSYAYAFLDYPQGETRAEKSKYIYDAIKKKYSSYNIVVALTDEKCMKSVTNQKAYVFFNKEEKEGSIAIALY